MQRSYRILFLFLILYSVRGLCTPQDERQVIGKAGDQFINEQEFIERYELTPDLYRHRKSQTELNKAEFLYSMIAEKLLAQEARARHLDTVPAFINGFRDLTKKIARDQLYKEEIRGKVDVTPREIRQGIAEAKKELFLQYLYFDDSASARFVRRQIRSTRDFDRMRVDSSLGAVSDTATVIWGDADTAIQYAAYKLVLNEISPVIRASTGYYILKLARVRPNAYYTSLQPDILRERVVTKLRERKERQETLRYLGRTLPHKKAFSPPGLFREFADKMFAVCNAHRTGTQNTLSQEMTAELADSCGEILQDSLIITPSRVWMVREVIGRLYLKSFPTTFTSVKQIGNALYDEFQEWADQELLEEEAISRGIDREEGVQEQLRPWQDRYLSDLMKEYIGRTIRATDADVYNYMKYSDSSTAVPMVQLRELHTQSLDEMRSAIADLTRGIPFPMVIQRYSCDPEEKKREGVGQPFPITARPPIGEIAWELEPGRQYGPIEDGSRYLLLEVMAKKNVMNSGDTSAAGRFQRARENFLRHKKARTITQFLAQTAAKRGYDVYLDRLKKIEVTTTPMLTYRFLGFGGRIFAVPFVDKQVDWLNEEPPAGVIVP